LNPEFFVMALAIAAAVVLDVSYVTSAVRFSELVLTSVTPSTFLAAILTATSQPPQNISGTCSVTVRIRGAC
jgi:hypothetical protein